MMKAAMARLAGQTVDGKTVNELVRKKLAGASRGVGSPSPSSDPLGRRSPGALRRPRRHRHAGQPRPRPRPRDQVLAALFGAGNDMDAFIVAFRIPNLVRDLFAEGAMSAAFVPTFTRHLTLSRQEPTPGALGNNVLNALLLVDRRARRRWA